MRTHRGALHRYALRLTHDAALAEDVLQDTFLAALGAREGLRQSASARAWLLSVARSRALMALRRRAGEPAAHEGLEALEVLGPAAGWGAPAPDPEALAVQLEERAALERALALVPPAEREALLLRDVEGLTGEEAAQVLGLSLPALKSRLHRARLHLVAALRQGGRGAEEVRDAEG